MITDAQATYIRILAMQLAALTTNEALGFAEGIEILTKREASARIRTLKSYIEANNY